MELKVIAIENPSPTPGECAYFANDLGDFMIIPVGFGVFFMFPFKNSNTCKNMY